VSLYATLNLISERCTYTLTAVHHAPFDIYTFPGRLRTAKWTVNHLRPCRKKKILYCEIKRIAIFFKISLQKRTKLHRSFNDDVYGNDALYSGLIVTAVQYFMLRLCGARWQCQKCRSECFPSRSYQAKVL